MQNWVVNIQCSMRFMASLLRPGQKLAEDRDLNLALSFSFSLFKHHTQFVMWGKTTYTAPIWGLWGLYVPSIYCNLGMLHANGDFSTMPCSPSPNSA